MLPRTCLCKSSDINLKLQNQKSTERVLTLQIWKQSSSNQKNPTQWTVSQKKNSHSSHLPSYLANFSWYLQKQLPWAVHNRCHIFVLSHREPVLQSTSTKILTWKCWDQDIKTQTSRFRSSHLFCILTEIHTKHYFSERLSTDWFINH